MTRCTITSTGPMASGLVGHRTHPQLFHLHTDISPALKLFAITGFLGGLTTFSSFSAETVERLLAGQAGWAFALMLLHLGGSLTLTWLGLMTVGAQRVWG
ncbi:CrcB family protein [Halomonas sp. A11-A]|jgi:CrcB protein|nr:CrcB family protein [Halomonas sp. A11-A]